LKCWRTNFLCFHGVKVLRKVGKGLSKATVKEKFGNNSSRDSHNGLSAIKRVLKVVLESEIELSPLEISRKAHVNHSTTRDYLRKLLGRNKIVQPYKGSYCSSTTHSMIFVPLRFHNILLTSSVPWLGFSDDVVEWVGGVKVRVQFGLQRRKITGRISCDVGMDKHATLFALHRFFDIVKARGGHDLDVVTVKTMESNRDFQGVRIDGSIKCLTRKGLFGVIERIYQKEESVVRVEQKTVKPMRLEEFEALLHGGVPHYNIEQGQYVLIQEIRRLVEAQKFANEQIGMLARTVKALVDANVRRQNNGFKGV